MPPDASSSPPFLIGANIPWLHYGGDFGANVWRPEGGIWQPAERAQLDAAFARLAASGVQWGRWFLFCDGRAGIRFGDEGQPQGLDEFVIRDVETALEIAQRHGIRIMFVLLDFLWCDAARALRGVQMGGRAQLLDTPAERQALLDVVFRPVLERYGHEPAIFAWDIINEPEWIKTLKHGSIDAFLSETVSLIRSSTTHPVTVGSAGLRWRDRYAALGLDFYQVHWYDSLKHQPSLETPVSRLGFDRPVLLGEFPTKGSRRTPDDIVATARTAGYSGAFYWSALSDDDCSAGSIEQDPAYTRRT
ncbi:MAG: hypothetical protein EHM55_12185 [Acidobacteria bacterium]|nr:MAG: hypothetical protein EHM55_12185 [Acidobacteriota bacterium]